MLFPGIEPSLLSGEQCPASAAQLGSQKKLGELYTLLNLVFVVCVFCCGEVVGFGLVDVLLFL